MTKMNFDTEFMNQTVGDNNLKELREMQEMQEQWEKGEFRKLPDCVTQLNAINGVGVTARKPAKDNEHTKGLMVVKGKYRGMIYTEENHTFKKILTIIQAYGFKIEKSFFLEEKDDKFTHISFTIKE